jgi:transcriptional regulator GlxA family with amidase domain
MRIFEKKPLCLMTEIELEDFLKDLDWVRSGGCTTSIDIVVEMISDLIEVEIANRD